MLLISTLMLVTTLAFCVCAALCKIAGPYSSARVGAFLLGFFTAWESLALLFALGSLSEVSGWLYVEQRQALRR
jgi:hypothetical protein